MKSMKQSTALHGAASGSIRYEAVDQLHLPSTTGRVLTRDEVEELLRSPAQLKTRAVQMRHLPRISSALCPGDLSFSARIQTCLENLKTSHGVTQLSQLSHLTIGELLHMKNFGPESLMILLSSVTPMILDNASHPSDGSSSDRQTIFAAVTQAAERLRAESYSEHIHCADPRFRSEVGALLDVANSGSEDSPLDASASSHLIAHRLVGRKRDVLPPEKILDAIRNLRDKVARAQEMPLGEELREIASAFAAGRDIEIIVTFFGWGGQGVKTLQAVGNEHDISRERVRQIVRKFIKKVQRARPFVPTLRRTIIHISKCLPAVVDDMEAEIYRIGLTRSLFQLDGIISAAEVFGVSVPFTIENHRGIQTVACHEDTGLAKSIMRQTRKRVSHAGLGNVADLCDRIRVKGGPAIGRAMVKSVLQSLASLRWLDQECEWFLLDDVRPNHLVTLVTKVLSVSPRIHVSEMRTAIARDYSGRGSVLPKSVVLEFCSTACNCNIEGDFLIASRTHSVTEALSKGEQIVYFVLVDQGPLLRRGDFECKCIERGLNLGTFRNYLCRLPFLVRYDPDVYGLRGAPNVSGDVERSLLSKLAADGTSGHGNLLTLSS